MRIVFGGLDPASDLSPLAQITHNLRNADVGVIRAATRTVNAIDLSMDKAGAAVAIRPLTPQAESTDTQGTGHTPTACQPGANNHGEGSSEFSRPEVNFRTSCHSGAAFIGRVEADTDAQKALRLHAGTLEGDTTSMGRSGRTAMTFRRRFQICWRCCRYDWVALPRDVQRQRMCEGTRKTQTGDSLD